MIHKKCLIIYFITLMSFCQSKLVTENTQITKNFILGKFNYTTHQKFVKVSDKHASKTIYLNKDAYAAFIKMYNQAKADGITLKIISGTRNFNEQKTIWERKWIKYNDINPLQRAKKILEYSSMPSTSRHHWGTDIDLNSFTNSYFDKNNGKKEYKWLVKNANNYGFHQIYTNKKNGRTGYNLERWHWSYIPLAKMYLNFYNTHINASDITGFKGSHLAETLRIIPNYVNGISHPKTIDTKTKI